MFHRKPHSWIAIQHEYRCKHKLRSQFFFLGQSKPHVTHWPTMTQYNCAIVQFHFHLCLFEFCSTNWTPTQSWDFSLSLSYSDYKINVWGCSNMASYDCELSICSLNNLWLDGMVSNSVISNATFFALGWWKRAWLLFGSLPPFFFKCPQKKTPSLTFYFCLLRANALIKHVSGSHFMNASPRGKHFCGQVRNSHSSSSITIVVVTL